MRTKCFIKLKILRLFSLILLMTIVTNCGIDGLPGGGGHGSKDFDDDGIINSEDDCPDKAGIALLNGCPVDYISDLPFDIGNGVNLQPSYFNNGNPTIGWDLMDSYSGIKSIRIEVEPFIDIEQAKVWAQGAQDIGLNVIITYHDNNGAGLGTNIKQNLLDAANWWATNYDALKETGPFLVNLSNEWGNHNLTAEEYADAYNDAIAIVRSVYDGLIIIDISGWGQNIQVAADASEMITDSDIVLSAHIYEVAYNASENRSLEAADLDILVATGRYCMIGEFGNDASNGGGGGTDWLGVVEHARDDLGWPILGWVWNGDGGAMNMVQPKWADNGAAEIHWEDDTHMDIIMDVIGGNDGGLTPQDCGTDPETSKPYCCSASSDPDNDGFGYEWGVECINLDYDPGFGCGFSQGGNPYCCDSSYYVEGEEWGYDPINDGSCVAQPADCGNASNSVRYCCGDGGDDDGDGWGWEYDASCVVQGGNADN